MGTLRNEPFHLAYQLDTTTFDRRYDQFDRSGSSKNKKDDDDDEG